MLSFIPQYSFFFHFKSFFFFILLGHTPSFPVLPADRCFGAVSCVSGPALSCLGVGDQQQCSKSGKSGVFSCHSKKGQNTGITSPHTGVCLSITVQKGLEVLLLKLLICYLIFISKRSRNLYFSVLKQNSFSDTFCSVCLTPLHLFNVTESYSLASDYF